VQENWGSWWNNICGFAPESQTDALQTALRIRILRTLADALASQLRISVEDKQGLLELFLLKPGLAAFD